MGFVIISHIPASLMVSPESFVMNPEHTMTGMSGLISYRKGHCLLPENLLQEEPSLERKTNKCTAQSE
jgi:hypothetical protein